MFAKPIYWENLKDNEQHVRHITIEIIGQGT